MPGSAASNTLEGGLGAAWGDATVGRALGRLSGNAFSEFWPDVRGSFLKKNRGADADLKNAGVQKQWGDCHLIVLLSTLLQQFGHQGRPSGLMAGAQSRAVVAVEIFVKRDVIAEMWIGLELLSPAEDRTPPVFVS